MSTMKITGRGIERAVVLTVDLLNIISAAIEDRDLPERLEPDRGGYGLAGRVALDLGGGLDELFEDTTDKIRALGLRAVCHWYPDDPSGGEALLDGDVHFEVFARPFMCVSQLDVIDQLIDHDVFAGVVALTEDEYPPREEGVIDNTESEDDEAALENTVVTAHRQRA